MSLIENFQIAVDNFKTKLIMKTIKKLTLFAAIGAFTMFSCGDDKNKSTLDESNVETEMTDMQNNADTVEKDNRVTTKNYAMKDGNSISYNQDERGVVSMKDWDDYTVVSYEMYDLEDSDFETADVRLANIGKRIDNLGNSIPTWLKTEEVMEDVADVQKEYKELIAEGNASEKEKRENYEELSEKFDDLREELSETIDEYIKVHKEAIEEFNEEMKDGDWRDAMEEYNEEIKKLNKITEDN